MPTPRRAPSWKPLGALGPPAVLLAILVAWLACTLYSQREAQREADREAVTEWLKESRPSEQTLPQLVADYLEMARDGVPADELRLKAEEVEMHLRALANPTREYRNRLLLAPTVYSIAVQFKDCKPPLDAIRWDDPLAERDKQQVQTLSCPLLSGEEGVELVVEYRLHASGTWQKVESRQQELLLKVAGLVGGAAVLGGLWLWWFFRRERRREVERLLAQHQVDQAERLLLEGELRQREAEQRRQAAERQALELESQLNASIGIMSGFYAHNIKNLLLRPTDLLRRCLEADTMTPDQAAMLQEVRQALGTATERLQQILRTVRREPGNSRPALLDLNELAERVRHAWQDLAEEKKLRIDLDLAAGPVPIMAQVEDLEAAVENLLCNARDATGEMRNRLRGLALAGAAGDNSRQRQALLAAHAWKGQVVLRTRRPGGEAVLEVQDNGIGMTAEVRRRCTETHFSTKRDNALYQGNGAGMGLGLSFVAAVAAAHRATLEIESRPEQGSIFRVRFPLAA
jgi:signal transduction histidine kinase